MLMNRIFASRIDAGQRLGAALAPFAGPTTIVLGIPRGGVVVASEVARALHSPLDILVTRKLGSPWQPEYAVGAIGEGSVRIVDDAAVRAANIDPAALREVEDRERAELARRTARYRGAGVRAELARKRVIVVDDGVATGATATAACRAARQLGADEIILAVPVAPAGWTDVLAGEADAFVAVATPERFFSVGQWYTRFDQTSDAEVITCLERRPSAG
jgi:putative phosphoribosyl transferase